jgi:hypothetical protein
VSFNILLESGDSLLLENGDNVVTEDYQAPSFALSATTEVTTSSFEGHEVLTHLAVTAETATTSFAGGVSFSMEGVAPSASFAGVGPIFESDWTGLSSPSTVFAGGVDFAPSSWTTSPLTFFGGKPQTADWVLSGYSVAMEGGVYFTPAITAPASTTAMTGGVYFDFSATTESPIVSFAGGEPLSLDITAPNVEVDYFITVPFTGVWLSEPATFNMTASTTGMYLDYPSTAVSFSGGVHSLGVTAPTPTIAIQVGGDYLPDWNAPSASFSADVFEQEAVHGKATAATASFVGGYTFVTDWTTAAAATDNLNVTIPVDVNVTMPAATIAIVGGFQYSGDFTSTSVSSFAAQSGLLFELAGETENKATFSATATSTRVFTMAVETQPVTFAATGNMGVDVTAPAATVSMSATTTRAGDLSVTISPASFKASLSGDSAGSFAVTARRAKSKYTGYHSINYDFGVTCRSVTYSSLGIPGAVGETDIDSEMPVVEITIFNQALARCEVVVKKPGFTSQMKPTIQGSFV